MKRLTLWLVVAAIMLVPRSIPAFQAKSATKATTQAASAPSDQEIADAKAKGLVWVNTCTKVYHKEGQFLRRS